VVVLGYAVVGGLVKDAGIGEGVAFNMLGLNPGVENSRYLAKIDTRRKDSSIIDFKIIPSKTWNRTGKTSP